MASAFHTTGAVVAVTASSVVEPVVATNLNDVPWAFTVNPDPELNEAAAPLRGGDAGGKPICTPVPEVPEAVMVLLGAFKLT